MINSSFQKAIFKPISYELARFCWVGKILQVSNFQWKFNKVLEHLINIISFNPFKTRLSESFWDRVFKNGPSKIYGEKLLKNLFLNRSYHFQPPTLSEGPMNWALSIRPSITLFSQDCLITFFWFFAWSSINNKKWRSHFWQNCRFAQNWLIGHFWAQSQHIWAFL